MPQSFPMQTFTIDFLTRNAISKKVYPGSGDFREINSPIHTGLHFVRAMIVLHTLGFLHEKITSRGNRPPKYTIRNLIHSAYPTKLIKLKFDSLVNQFPMALDLVHEYLQQQDRFFLFTFHVEIQ